MKNYCICKIKEGILYRDRNCPGRFHNGEITEYEPKQLQDLINKKNRIGWLGTSGTEMSDHDY